MSGCQQYSAADTPKTKTNETSRTAANEEKKGMKTETATFAAGCFWGVEATFRQIKGVKATAVGYTGGRMDKPTYEDVCTNATGHAEAVEVEFDPTEVGYGQLLDVFWKNHDPTTLNRQGPDHGTQYRSAIFYHSPEQKTAAEASKQALEKSGKYRRPIVTEIVPASTFWKAEDYHQQYLEKRGMSSCHMQ
jgi:peptide-methionine (S)-S-oxide reductase